MLALFIFMGFMEYSVLIKTDFVIVYRVNHHPDLSLRECYLSQHMVLWSREYIW